MKKILYIALVALCAACTPADVDPSKLFMTESQVQEMIDQNGGKCLTIEEFKAEYMTEEGNYCMPELYRQRSKAGNYYLFSVDTVPATETPIYIRGRVTTDDYAGNFYKTLCIQQVFVNGNDTTQQALRLSVDAGSIGGLYQLGQEIMIRVDGLAMGRYATTIISTPTMLSKKWAGHPVVFQSPSSKRVPPASVCPIKVNCITRH